MGKFLFCKIIVIHIIISQYTLYIISCPRLILFKLKFRQLLAGVDHRPRWKTGQIPGADPGFVERGGAAATASAAGTKVFGGSRLKTLFGISKGGVRAPCAPPESASGGSSRPHSRTSALVHGY